MLRSLFKKTTPKRIDTIIISDTASVLASDAMAIKRAWHPAWADAAPLSVLALTIVRNHKKPATALDAALLAYVAESKLTPPLGTAMTSYQFDTATAMSGNAWHYGREYELAIKGAPEKVLAYCDLTESEREEIFKALAGMAPESHQVIALAHSKVRSAPKVLSAVPARYKFAFAGLISTGITLRPYARQAVKSALQSGVSVRIVTGAHLETAVAMSRQLGLTAQRDHVLDCRKLQHVNSEEAEKIIEQAIVFAHATPKDKQYITRLIEQHHTAAVINSDTTDFPAFVQALIKTTQ